MSQWFEVDRAGLAKILRRRGIEFAIFELIQNAWDEPGVTKVNVTLEYVGRSRVDLTIEDDAPEGFKDLTHAFTLFAESAKKSNPTQRGRFNLGEKLVVALCDEYRIHSTTGSVVFDASGRTVRHKATTEKGTVIEATLKMTREELDQVEAEIVKLIPPVGIDTYYNGEMIIPSELVRTIPATLPTEIADEEGALRKSKRATIVHVYRPADGEAAMIYEMGIPVVEHDCAFHCDVQQKIPLTLDRENVSTRFLRALRVAVFNATHNLLDAEAVTHEWAQTAIESPDADPEAVRSYVEKRFGEKAVSFDPSDPEANKRAVSAGYTLIHGGMLSGDAWRNVREHASILPAGKVTPSDKAWNGQDNPDALAATPIPFEKWTDGMRQVAAYALTFSRETIGRGITVSFYSEAAMLAAACYGSGSLSFNKLRLGNAFFDLEANRLRIDDLLIHELGHEYSGDHLSAEYYKALTLIGAKAIAAARKGNL